MMETMYDDEDDEYEDDEEENFAANVEAARREDAEATRGKDERDFYDGLAKQEDVKHNAMRVEMQKRLLSLGELRQKLRHKEAELRTLESKIRVEEERIEYEAKKAYRSGTDDALEVSKEEIALPIPILSKDIDKNDVGVEFSIERAKANTKQLEEEKVELGKVIKHMSIEISDEARALSQLQHSLLRM